MWLDEILRAAVGFLACLPLLTWCQAKRLKAVPTGLLLTFYMVGVWRMYAAAAAWVVQ